MENTKDYLSLKLLRIISSPFVTNDNSQILPVDRNEAGMLYQCAQKNKIGLFFLEVLNKANKLDEYELNSVYNYDKERHIQQVITLKRVASILNEADIDYAVFKSIAPFPTIMNDTDIIHFGSDSELKRVCSIMQNSGFDYFCSADADSRQLGFHDFKMGGKISPHPKINDPYDVDIYQEATASYLQYLDKNKLRKYIQEISFGDCKIKVFKTEAELITVIVHSVIPTLLFTLLPYYVTLFYLKSMKNTEIDEFLNLAKINHVKAPVKSLLSLVAEIHKAAHGFIPIIIQDILTEIKIDKSEVKSLQNSNYVIPHHYNWTTIIKTLLEKTLENQFVVTVPVQCIHMLNPKVAKWVFQQTSERRNKDTY